MKKNTKVKNKLKQFGIAIVAIILLTLISYITLENNTKLSQNIINETARNQYSN